MTLQERISTAIQEKGLVSFVKTVGSVSKRKFAIGLNSVPSRLGLGVDALQLRREELSRLVLNECGRVIRYGPLTGVKLVEEASWGVGDKAAMVLGFYEQELVTSLLDTPQTYRTFVDVGAADGYYAVGLLKAGRFDRSVCFEIRASGRDAITRLAAHNEVSDRVSILAGADRAFTDQIVQTGARLDDCVILMDIEGHEFSLLNRETFATLRTSILLVELHEYGFSNPEEKLDELQHAAAATHRTTLISPGPRDPSRFAELARFRENERWLLCSENRMTGIQRWMRFDPLSTP